MAKGPFTTQLSVEEAKSAIAEYLTTLINIVFDYCFFEFNLVSENNMQM